MPIILKETIQVIVTVAITGGHTFEGSTVIDSVELDRDINPTTLCAAAVFTAREKARRRAADALPMSIEALNARLQQVCSAARIPHIFAEKEIKHRAERRSKTAESSDPHVLINELIEEILCGRWPTNYDRVPRQC